MTLNKALMKCPLGQTISSEKAQMLSQDRESILYWLIGDNPFDSNNPIGDIEYKKKVLEKILTVKDWKIDPRED